MCRRQKKLLGEKIIRRLGPDLMGKVIGVWGLAFKPRTDDVRESPALVLVEQLVQAGATILATDPEAIDEAKGVLCGLSGFDQINFVDSAEDACTGADAVVLITEWSEFRNPDFRALKAVMRQPIIFDGRNVLVPEVVHEAGFEYHGVGRIPPA